jgi:hypothetical protein
MNPQDRVHITSFLILRMGMILRNNALKREQANTFRSGLQSTAQDKVDSKPFALFGRYLSHFQKPAKRHLPSFNPLICALIFAQ